MKLKLNLGANIKTARLNSHLSQQEFADKITQFAIELGYEDLKVGNTAISNWENGTSKPDADTIFLICKVLNVDANYLLDWDGYVAVNDLKDTLKRVLKENNFFDGDDLTEENLEKLIKFINANKEFILDKKN